MKPMIYICAVLLQTAALSPALAHAGTVDPTLSKTVKVGDLDLHRESGARTAMVRIRNAAKSVCLEGYSDWGIYVRSSRGYRTCVAEATSRAVASAQSPVLTAMADGDGAYRIARASTQ